ncbi:MAG: hypothetical protein P0Y53_23495 [Candidatus Pseudobacter hemicellulosilyticus]|uniref:Uncharacterized protein n=1 Tax=Candidatus Pseudobacter hemicellulosilyticus TaxID=3121375 RepID=A0AAJ6BGN5_9BACT|nr:MAG: hypothetical protein P0Y53_23495 [Pseudobacter sp.]
MKQNICSLLLLTMFACQGRQTVEQSDFTVTGEAQQTVFQSLMSLTLNNIPDSTRKDSLVFLILPVQKICPGCRMKTIDSLDKHKKHFPNNHYMIISAQGGFKTISTFFWERKTEIPNNLSGRLFLDSTDQANQFDLYDKKPTIYYSYQGKVYRKVSAIPQTVKQDLQEYFSGYRTINEGALTKK